jgi:hypothetical protein
MAKLTNLTISGPIHPVSGTSSSILLSEGFLLPLEIALPSKWQLIHTRELTSSQHTPGVACNQWLVIGIECGHCGSVGCLKDNSEACVLQENQFPQWDKLQWPTVVVGLIMYHVLLAALSYLSHSPLPGHFPYLPNKLLVLKSFLSVFWGNPRVVRGTLKTSFNNIGIRAAYIL